MNRLAVLSIALAVLIGISAESAADARSSITECMAAQDAANPGTDPALTGSCQVGSVRNP